VSGPRRIAGVAVALVWLVVPPWLLVRFAGAPLRGWPTGQQVRLWVAHPLTAQTLAAAVTVLAWLLWALLAFTVVATVGRRIGAGVRVLRRLPLPTPLQATATGMAGAAALTAGVTTSAGPPAPPIGVPAGALGGDAPVPVSAGEGVSVAGGWMPRHTAEQVAAAVSLVWLRRRRSYHPAQPHEHQRPDPDLEPLPATATALQAALAAGLTHPDDGHAMPPPPVDAPTLGAPAGTVVALTGAGAADAARGALVTGLLAALHDPPGTIRLVITRRTLITLLPSATSELVGALAGLAVTDALDQALALIGSRLPPLAARQAAEPPHDAQHATPPPLLLITDTPPAPDAEVTTSLAAAGATALIVGAGPLAGTVSIGPGGHTTGPAGSAGPRMCVLNSVAAMDLLTIIAQPSPPPVMEHPTTRPGPGHAQPSRGGQVRVPRQAAAHRTMASSAPKSRARVELRVLGKPALQVDQHAVTIRRSAALQVLVYLAVHHDGATTAELVGAIWPGLPPHTVTGRLYTTLSELRTSIRNTCGLTLVLHTDDRYRLDDQHLDVDLWRLRAAAQHAATTLTGSAEAWRAVIDAYTGDLAAAHTWPWIDPPRESTRRIVLDAYATAAATATATDPHRSLHFLQEGIRVDPYNEDLHRRAIDALTALGDHAGAARLRDAYRRRLELAGIHPGHALAHVGDTAPAG
jgi:DNA-binding SARP family transcriptional activator